MTDTTNTAEPVRYVELDVDALGVIRAKGSYGQVLGYLDTPAEFNRRGRGKAKAKWTVTLQGTRVADGDNKADLIMFVTHCFVATLPTFDNPSMRVVRIDGTRR